MAHSHTPGTPGRHRIITETSAPTRGKKISILRYVHDLKGVVIVFVILHKASQHCGFQAYHALATSASTRLTVCSDISTKKNRSAASMRIFTVRNHNFFLVPIIVLFSFPSFSFLYFSLLVIFFSALFLYFAPIDSLLLHIFPSRLFFCLFHKLKRNAGINRHIL